MSACNFDPYIIPDYSPNYLIIVDHLKDLGVELNSSEIKDMEESRDLWFEYVPIDISKYWYNVRIGCGKYSIIAIAVSICEV